MIDPPHFQILHSLQADAPGGASLFADGLHAATKLRFEQRHHFDALTRYKVQYHYSHNKQEYYHNEHPTIKLSPLGDRRVLNSDIEGLFYSPPFQYHDQPAEQIDPENNERVRFVDYHAAIRAFAAIVEDKDTALFERRLAPGEAVVFDNRRILHARTAFDPTQGGRWLKGAYVNGDGFRALLRGMHLFQQSSRPHFEARAYPR